MRTFDQDQIFRNDTEKVAGYGMRVNEGHGCLSL